MVYCAIDVLLTDAQVCSKHAGKFSIDGESR